MFPHWIKQLLGAGISKVTDLAQRVWQTFALLWTIIRQLGEAALSAWRHLYNIGNLVVSVVRGALAEAYQTVRYVFTVLVPHYAADAIERATRWAAEHLTALERKLTAALSAARSLLNRLITDLRAALTIAQRALVAGLNAALDRLRRLETLAANLLSSPSRLVAWILPALWGPVWRFIESRAEPIGVWIVRKSIAAVIRELPLIERVLARII